MTELNTALALIGVLVISVGLLSNLIKKSLVQEPMIAVAAGIVAGPYVLGWLDLGRWGDETAILEQSARLTLAIALMGVALRLEKASTKRLLRPVALLLTLGMLGMWLASSALAGWLLGLALWPALLIGAVVTPTDPVVASSIVTGPFARNHLPVRVRDTISLESGSNDGLAYALVLLPLLMIEHEPAEAWWRWLTETLLLGVGLAVVIGVVIGLAAAKVLRLAQSRKLIESHSALSFTIALSLLTLGGAALVGADALISVFVAGLVFNLNSDVDEQHEEERIQEAISKLFTLPMFVIFGVSLPLAEWTAYGWQLPAFALLVLFLRRPPVVMALLPAMGPELDRDDVAYIGWFGPIGIAGIYYASLARNHLGDPAAWHIASAVVLCSILAHGATAAPLTRLHSRLHERSA
ncbi:MAG TPA: cation:proton antiporter [Devosiaceae bacterium]|jgi:NhaP-type Na+/H+ or K+/H+ antiporter|nr:cation:proton antiporter [Devosiaceae bacterium]